MTELTHAEKLRRAGIAKYGSEEAWRAAKRKHGMKARRDTPRGFAVLKTKNPELFKELSSRGGRKYRPSEAKETTEG